VCSQLEEVERNYWKRMTDNKESGKLADRHSGVSMEKRTIRARYGLGVILLAGIAGVAFAQRWFG
jgi:hypothetical protein